MRTLLPHERAAFPLLHTQRKEHERKDLADKQISNTSVEIGHKAMLHGHGHGYRDTAIFEK